MNWTAFTPISALVGGGIIGLAVSFFLLLSGRVAGISGIVVGLFAPKPGDFAWRLAFTIGLLGVGVVAALAFPEQVTASSTRSPLAMLAAGVIVGYGTRLGNGCTSGHGVCGIPRFSVRSLVATATFMTTGILTVSIIHFVLGGSL